MGQEAETPPAGCGRKVQAAIKGHWTVPPKYRSTEQDEAEEWLFTVYLGKNRYATLQWVRFNRWYLFFASFIVQFCIGSLYSWSVLNKPIDTYLFNDAKAEKAVNSFYIAVGMFGTTTAIMGPWIERHGPRAGIVLGATSFLIGKIVVAIGLHADLLGIVYVGYGVFCGFGMGLCYISPVSALQKWFPDYRGMAAGFAVGGYGAGSVVWSKVYLPTIKAVGLPSMFILLGCVISFTLFVCAIVLRNPHPEFVIGGLNIHGEAVEEAEEALHRGEKLSVMSNHEYESITTPSAKDIQDVVKPADSAHAHVKKLTLIQAILSPDFVCLYLMFFANQLYGLIVLSKLSSMCTDIFGKDADKAADIVSINGVFNCCGRLVFPAATDLLTRLFKIEHAFARKCFYFYALASQIIIIAVFPTLFRNDEFTAFCILAFILTGSYGGGFGTIPAFLTDMFGAFNIGAMHGLILTSWSLGGVAGGISFNSAYRRLIADDVTIPEAYISNIHKIFALVCAGAVFIFFVRTNPRDRFERGYHLSLCGKRIVSFKSNKNPDEPLLDA